MKKIKFAIGIHNHQPIGNFDFVFEDAYHKAYIPFLDVLERHPKIKIALHYTGVLFEWLLNRDQSFGPRLKKLVTSGQLEMMSGGYYEPILVNIPDEDKLGQIEKLNKFVKHHIGYEPIGLWLAERIWEPQLPKPLALSGTKYLVIDDSHFKTAGLEEEELFGYYLTEETGHVIKIFPISERLRYTIPFQAPEVTIDYLRSIATEACDRLIVFADDGEKFGIWPGTHAHCYQNHWLEKFFSLLEANLDWIEIVHFSEAIEKLLPLGSVYLPTASYREMMEWALPAKAIERYEDFEHQLKHHGLFDNYKVFVRGGFWRNFLAKYPESNNLHKKSLWVSKKIQALKTNKKYDPELIEKAQDFLWAGQTNCPYWHGVFGGLYLNNLRYAVYSQMIQAETVIDQIVKPNAIYQAGWIDFTTADFDADGQDEAIVETKVLNLYFSPHLGGALFELDYKPRHVNLLDTMTRRKEAYHNKLLALKNNQPAAPQNDSIASIHDMVVSKEPGLENKLFYDKYRRSSLIDHFFGPATKLDDVLKCDYDEVGDFIPARYSFETESADGGLTIRFHRDGLVRCNDQNRRIHLAKAIKFSPKHSSLEISYEMKNLESTPIELWFGPEFNFALLAGNAPDRYYHFDREINASRHLASVGAVDAVQRMGLKDEWMRIDVQLQFSVPATVWRFPVETISQSEGGFERVYQSSVVIPNWKIRLKPAERWYVKIKQIIVDL